MSVLRPGAHIDPTSPTLRCGVLDGVRLVYPVWQNLTVYVGGLSSSAGVPRAHIVSSALAFLLRLLFTVPVLHCILIAYGFPHMGTLPGRPACVGETNMKTT